MLLLIILLFSMIQKNLLINYFKKNVCNDDLSRDTTKKIKISEGYLVRENVKSLSNSVTKFCDQGICEEFHFFRH